MMEMEISIPLQTDLSQAEQIIEQRCMAEGLSLSLKGSLSKYPGCVHWHLKREGQRGTLEITLWARVHRIWFSIHTGRTGDWIEETLFRLKHDLEKDLAARAVARTTSETINRSPS